MSIKMSQPCKTILMCCTNICPTEYDDPDAYDKVMKQLDINNIQNLSNKFNYTIHKREKYFLPLFISKNHIYQILL